MKQGGMVISELRAELGLSLEAFAERVGLASRGRMSVIERENRCSLDVALRIEALSEGRIDAASLSDDVRAARHGVTLAMDPPVPSPGKPGKISPSPVCPPATGDTEAGAALNSRRAGVSQGC